MTHQLAVSLITVVAIFFSFAQPSPATEFPVPKVEFSATMSMTIEADSAGQPYHIKGKIYSAKGKERREVSTIGQTTAIITDRNKDEVLTLMPHQKMYMKNQSTDGAKNPEAMIRDGQLKLTKQGTETIRNHKTTKYKFESAQMKGESFVGFAWFTRQNIPIRFKGKISANGVLQKVEINYDNIVIAKQDPKLFKVPDDYLPLAARLGGKGAGKGMTPEQAEQLKEQFKQMMKEQMQKK